MSSFVLTNGQEVKTLASLREIYMQLKNQRPSWVCLFGANKPEDHVHTRMWVSIDGETVGCIEKERTDRKGNPSDKLKISGIGIDKTKGDAYLRTQVPKRAVILIMEHFRQKRPQEHWNELHHSWYREVRDHSDNKQSTEYNLYSENQPLISEAFCSPKEYPDAEVQQLREVLYKAMQDTKAAEEFQRLAESAVLVVEYEKVQLISKNLSATTQAEAFGHQLFNSWEELPDNIKGRVAVLKIPDANQANFYPGVGMRGEHHYWIVPE